jgi:hypothetical protein
MVIWNMGYGDMNINMDILMYQCMGPCRGLLVAMEEMEGRTDGWKGGWHMDGR